MYRVHTISFIFFVLYVVSQLILLVVYFTIPAKEKKKAG